MEKNGWNENIKKILAETEDFPERYKIATKEMYDFTFHNPNTISDQVFIILI